MPTSRYSKPVVAWVMYDWAVSAFSTTVMAGFFPIFFKQYWSAGVEVTTSTFRLGVANSAASLCVAFLAPLLGALADRRGSRRGFLLAFAAIGVIATGLLYAIGEGAWRSAAIVYAVSVIGFSGSMVFYDALLVSVAPPGERDYISALGFAIGYLGGGVLFAINVAMTLFPATFGLADTSAAVRVSFLTVAVWWAVFSIPAARYLGEQRIDPATATPRRNAILDVVDTIKHLRRHRWAFLFLIAYWFYIDGVHTIVRMAVDYGLSIGFTTQSLIGALLLVQFVGFPASIAFGKFAERAGPKRGIMIAIIVYVVISVWAARMTQAWEFYALATGIGLVQGAINSLSRSFYARLIPPERSAQFFGFYNTVGRFSAVLGPVLMGWVGYATGRPRLSMLSVILLFAVGGVLLSRVPYRARVT